MAKEKRKTKSPGTLAENRKARHDYNIEDTVEAGITTRIPKSSLYDVEVRT